MDDFLKQMEGPTVLIKVGTGEDSRDFTVPKALLCDKSKWFKNALSHKAFIESRTGVIHLPEDTVSGFTSFYFYLFTKYLAYRDVKLGRDTAELFIEQLDSAVEAWLFADKYLLLGMRNCAMYALCAHLSDATCEDIGIPAASLAACFARTADSSPLRMIVADYVVTRMDEERLDAEDLVQELAGEEGFVKALHEAQNFHHREKKRDTRRRYQRLGRFKGLLLSPIVRDADGDEPRMVGYDAEWLNLQMCWGCGTTNEPDPQDCPQCRNMGRSMMDKQIIVGGMEH
ncbi:hypothetical protein CERZMDRAFT_96186 [Cercospora zeae-maydis SCOH1-5]|uniref:BTB domain-containing protein n=1 Tax=Cercospora zeae-maydis SCOH1-5 TaxID=717836 RepID=A0A6A6FL41_9PEZI|nr:hypothetical protein CERZMDRAFT_96186 [Cercospora zeae-maydis SCOH1-5]